MRRTTSPLLWAVASAAALLPAGCAPETAPPARITHYRAPLRRFRRIHRVVFVELTGPDKAPTVAPDASEALLRALQGRQLFRVERVRRDDPRCRDLPLHGNQRTLEELIALHKALRCEAILLGSVDHFRAYPRMQVGLYLSLLDLRSGDMLWGVDHIWDTTDRDTELRVRDYFVREFRSGYEPVDWQLAMVSPKAFLKFVAHEAAKTLPTGETVARAHRPRPATRATLEKNQEK